MREGEERSDSSGTISSRSHRTSCHPRPYISCLVLSGTRDTLHRKSSPSPFPHVLLGTPGPATLDVANWAHSPLAEDRAALRAIYVDHSTDKRLSFPLRSYAAVRLFSFFPAALRGAIVSRGTRRGSIELRVGKKTRLSVFSCALVINWKYELSFIGNRGY